MISELTLRNREALSKKVINQFPSLKKTRPHLEMKHLKKELKRKRQNNGKIKTEINGVNFRVVLGWAYRGLTGGFLLLQNFSVAISVSPHVCFILVLILIFMFLR